MVETLKLTSRAAEGGGLDAALLYLTRYDVDAVLRQDDKVSLHLVNLLNKARELIITLDEHLLVILRVLAEERAT